MIPKEIKRKIEEYCKNEYGNYETTSMEGRTSISVAKKAAEKGYSLAEAEIQRLKELIEAVYKLGLPVTWTDEREEKQWQQFKQNNNL